MISTFRASPAQGVADALRGVRTSYLGGKLDEAVQDCADTLATHPENADAWFMLSVLEARRQRLPEAIKAIEKAILLRPAHVLYREAAALHYIRAKRLNVAASQLETVDALTPKRLRVSLRLTLLAMAARDQHGRRHWLRQSLKRLPSSMLQALVFAAGVALTVPAGVARTARRRVSPITAAQLAIAWQHARAGRTAMAERLAMKAAGRDYGDPEAALFLSRLHAREGGLSRARDIAATSLELMPEHPGLLSEYAIALSRVGCETEARAALARVKAWHRGAPDYARGHAFVQVKRGDIDAAWPHIERCLSLWPAKAEVHELAGRAFARLGWTGEARDFFRRAAALAPGAVQAWIELADGNLLSPDSPAYKRLTEHLNDPCVSQSTRARLHFVAGWACERAQKFEDAFALFEQGNFLTDVAYRHRGWVDHIDRLCKSFDAAYFARIATFGDAAQRPIFIVGMPHAGTRLVEAMLGRHPSIASGGERPTVSLIADELVRRLTPATPWPGPATVLDVLSCKAAAARYGAEARQDSADAAHVTDSTPHNFLHLGLIATLFPKAVIVHCTRDPVDTCLSLYTRLINREHAYGFDLGHLGAYFRQYERLIAHWRGVLPIPIQDVGFDALLADPRAAIEPVLNQMGLAWDEACLAPIAAAREGVRHDAACRKAYQRHLGPLIAALGSSSPG